MAFPRHPLQEELAIRELVSIKYAELPRQFIGAIENYDFWQCIFVEYGEFEINVDGSKFDLAQGEAVFYKPHSSHTGTLKNGKSSVLIIINFDCDSPCLQLLENRRFRLSEEERRALACIVREGFGSAEASLERTHHEYPGRGGTGYPFGTAQMIRNYMEILLLQLLRRQMPDGVGENGEVNGGASALDRGRPVSLAGEARSEELYTQMMAYFRERLGSTLTVAELCDAFAISATRLKLMFKQKTGMGIIETFNSMKIREAKRLIREESVSFAEIARRLGYSSNQQFSKQFKRIAKMSPSDYAVSIKARSLS